MIVPVAATITMNVKFAQTKLRKMQEKMFQSYAFVGARAPPNAPMAVISAEALASMQGTMLLFTQSLADSRLTILTTTRPAEKENAITKATPTLIKTAIQGSNSIAFLEGEFLGHHCWCGQFGLFLDCFCVGRLGCHLL